MKPPKQKILNKNSLKTFFLWTFVSASLAGTFSESFALGARSPNQPPASGPGQNPPPAQKPPVQQPPTQNPPPAQRPPEQKPPEQKPEEPIMRKYSYVDPKRLIRREALEKLLTYYDRNLKSLRNSRYVTAIDFSIYSGRPRFFVVDMQSGEVESYHTSHGKGSDPDHNGYADRFSNEPGSNASSLGFYLTAETYSGTHGYSLRLDGLSATNSKARERAIVIHPADYVNPSLSKMGRSHGCPALSPSVSRRVIDQIKNGSLIYAFR